MGRKFWFYLGGAWIVVFAVILVGMVMLSQTPTLESMGYQEPGVVTGKQHLFVRETLMYYKPLLYENKSEQWIVIVRRPQWPTWAGDARVSINSEVFKRLNIGDNVIVRYNKDGTIEKVEKKT